MTIKRTSTKTEVAGRIPFRKNKREVPDVSEIGSGHRENILIQELPLSQSSGRVEWLPYTLIFESDECVILEKRDYPQRWPYIYQAYSIPNTEPLRLVGDEINWYLSGKSYEYGTPRTDSKDFKNSKDVTFEYEPNLPSQSRR